MILPKYAYFRGRVVPYSEAKVGVMTHAFNYGTGCFGGMRGYWNSDEEQLFLFRPHDHFHRFLNSARLLCMDLGLTSEEMLDISLEVLRAEGYREDCYVRPLAYKADEIIGVRLNDLEDEFTLFAIPFTRYVENDEGAHVTFSSWRRTDDNSIPARGKLTGSYVNSAFIKTDALRQGFDEALVLTREGHVSEGSAENVFIVRDQVLITPPVTENILEGITRRTAMTLATEELGLQVVERPIDRTEVYLCDELFLTGTAAAITAVARVDYRPVGNGVMGPVTAKLRRLYDDVVRGRIPRYRRWNEPVYVAQPATAR
ncbi:MAG TPA: branched-chain amino acid transaminase [Anaerolineales bacterium]|nr:branched-chain amino acid transaminase [Anaerolineales bacterium]